MSNKDFTISKYLKWFVPALMIVVLCFQLYSVSFYNLSRWKGAGMGMFSTYKKRIVKVSSPEYMNNTLFSTPIPDPFEFSLEELPSAGNADGFWNFVVSTHFFGKENQIHSVPYLHIGELPSSMRIARMLNEVSLLNQMSTELRQIHTGTVQVFGIKSYETGRGIVHFETLLRREYGSTSPIHK
ncbi:MAG: hypothetical protein KBB54_02120 [Candidatus Pacebacteria bacterium]|nr:hypothetical protein [Candidatus Paceibacterota bacterium]MBP9818467.1 hypothetical protein [Candidatus Paceibacterota bacterium]